VGGHKTRARMRPCHEFFFLCQGIRRHQPIAAMAGSRIARLTCSRAAPEPGFIPRVGRPSAAEMPVADSDAEQCFGFTQVTRRVIEQFRKLWRQKQCMSIPEQEKISSRSGKIADRQSRGVMQNKQKTGPAAGLSLKLSALPQKTLERATGFEPSNPTFGKVVASTTKLQPAAEEMGGDHSPATRQEPMPKACLELQTARARSRSRRLLISPISGEVWGKSVRNPSCESPGPAPLSPASREKPRRGGWP